MPSLEVITASAGAGKTTDLCENVGDAVVGGLDPARILATTFTRKAAAELKGRIQAKILSHPELTPPQRLEFAERLELAAIGTVHSVGHRLATRYAIPLGLSPRIEVLEEEGSQRNLRDLLRTMDTSSWDELSAISYQFSLTEMHKLVLALLDAKRSNRISNDAFRQQMLDSCQRLSEILHAQGPTASGIGFEGLYAAAETALRCIESKTDTTGKTNDAKQELRRLLAGREPIWENFLRAAKIKAGTRSGADACLSDLRSAGGAVRREPDLHAAIRRLAERLADQTLLLEQEHRRYKAERGLADFTDLEELFLVVLETPDLVESLAAEFGLVVVDEFQDTNPIQLAIFQRLRSLVPRCRWVGDPKQAIFGFRGTDPSLVQAVWSSVPNDARDTLPSNYRSNRGLVQLFSRLFQPVLGKDAEQEPKRPGTDRGIERWILDATNQEEDQSAIGIGIAQLHAEGVPLRDIAVLGRINDQLKSLATTLKRLGIPARLELPGLFATREGALTLAGLRLVADRRDSLAAAAVLHILGDSSDETPKWLEERLAAVQDSETADPQLPDAIDDGQETSISLCSSSGVPWPEDPRLNRLGLIDHRTLPPWLVVQSVIQALDLGRSVCRWGDVDRRNSQLDAIVRRAQQYEQECRNFGAAATLTGLITYFEQLREENKDMRLAPQGLDAVTLLTHHKSKGLEWPVVILTGLAFDRDPDMWTPTVTGGKPDRDPLAGRSIRYWPWPFGRNPKFPTKVLQGSGLEIDGLNSPEGQGAAQKTEEEAIRLLYVGFTRARDKLVLAHRATAYDWLQKLPDIDSVLDPTAPVGEHPLESIDTTYVMRQLDAKTEEAYRQLAPTDERWLSVSPAATAPVSPVVARYHQPSAQQAEAVSPSVAIHTLPGKPVFPTGAKPDQYDALGNAVHAYLAAVPSLAGLEQRLMCKAATRCLRAFGVEGLIAASDLVTVGESLRTWVDASFPGAVWYTEVPVTAPRSGAGQWLGTIDLLLQLPNGNVVVIDHKSAPIQKKHCQAKAAGYSGQIAAYRQVLEDLGFSVHAAYIHFPLAGAMAKIEP